jgi:PAS domain S-box-containing protein
MKTEKPCLKCHAAQGYREGDVRGGISVTLPIAELELIMNSSNIAHFVITFIVWGLGMAGIWFSICAVDRRARALSESEKRYRLQFQQSQAVMLIVNPENGAIVDVNSAACSFYGYTEETLLTLKISDINISPSTELSSRLNEVRDGSTRQFLASHRLSGGTLRDVEVFSNPVTFSGQVLLHSIIFDISDRIAAERELSSKTDFAESLLLNSTAPTFVIDADHNVLIWNRALEELTGVKAQEMIGTGEHWRAFYPSSRPCLADLVLDGKFEAAPGLYSHLTRSRLIPDGLHAEGDNFFESRTCRLVFSAAPIRDRAGRIIAAIETLEDVTERLSLEAQLFQAQKMESVGVLAGGIAHDFNNVLTVISGYADLLQLTLGSDEQSLQFAREISASVERAADMTRSLLAFSGKHEIMLQYDDLNLILAAIRKSLIRLIREDITLTILPDEERLPVYVDRVQIEQMLINLVVNARDAMGAGGTITVSTMVVEREDSLVEGNAVILPGCYARLSVADNGAGMDAGTLAHIFEPFFTTKQKGKGTGLGLSIVRNMVTKHNGYISVISAPGVGTEFRVYLPLHAGEATQEQGENRLVINHNGTETVLVVEDDKAIMKLHKDVLGRYGYSVLAAVDGVEAMEVFNANIDEIRVAVVDVIMPRMNGRELVEQIRRQRPELPIIMISGYTDEIIDLAAIDDLRVVFMQKPVRPLDLMAAIQSSLRTNG